MSVQSFLLKPPREVSARKLLDRNEPWVAATHAPAPRSAQQLSVSFEFFPPASTGAEATLWATLSRLEALGPRFVSVTYGADGSSRERTVETVRRVQRLSQLTVVPHVTGVALCHTRLAELARQYWTQGVRHIVALRGDLPAGNHGRSSDYASAVELVADLKRIADFEISVAAYPEVHPEAKSAAADILHLKRKVSAGATQAITQFFYDNDVFLRFRDACVRAQIMVPIVPGILPLANLAQVSRFAERCGATIPAALRARFAGIQNDPASTRMVAAAVMFEQIEGLRRAGVESFHFYTLNRADVVYPVCLALGLGRELARVLA
jgi:methylenetetrahydrofolate reductase (NADPH)